MLVDIHSHILWGLDDGPGSLLDSVSMVEFAALHGTSDIVATPHASVSFPFDPELMQARICELQTRCGCRIAIHSGCDLHLSYENVQSVLDSPYRYTINQKNYLLVEFSNFAIIPSPESLFSRLMAMDIIPVITHPERNVLLTERLDDLRRWVDGGCLLQITAQSLLGGFGRRAKNFADALIRKGLAHVVASDGHDIEFRPPRIDLAYEYVEAKFGTFVSKRLFRDNPRSILHGEDLSRDDLVSGEGALQSPDGLRRFYGTV